MLRATLCNENQTGPFDVIFSPIMLSSLIHPSFEKNNILFGYLEEQWQPMVWLGWKCGKSEVRSWERAADILLGAGGGSLSELADEVKMASSVWRPSMLFSHQWQLSVHHLSLPFPSLHSLPPSLPLPSSSHSLSLDLSLLSSSRPCSEALPRKRDGRLVDLWNRKLSFRTGGAESPRTAAKSQVFVGGR